MKKLSKKQREAMVERQIQAAVVGLQIPIMAIPKIYREGEWLLEPGVLAGATRHDFVAQLQEFALANGATRVTQTSYYSNGKRGSLDGAPIWRPKWFGELGNDAEFREATKPRTAFKAAYYQDGHRLTIEGVPIRLAGHVKEWTPRAKSALGRGTATWKEDAALKAQAEKLGLAKAKEAA